MNLGNRSLRLALFAVAVGALGFGAYAAKTGVAHKADAQRAAGLARDRARDVAQSLDYAQQRDKWVSSAMQLVSDSKAVGITPEQWVERKINYRGVSATRVEADRLIRDTASDQGRLFVADSFELSVLGGNEGLFDTPSADDRGLTMTLAGSYYAWELNRPAAVQLAQNTAPATTPIKVAMPATGVASVSPNNGNLRK